MTTALAYFVVLTSAQFPGLNRELFGPVWTADRAARAADEYRERAASYETISVVEESREVGDDPRIEPADACLCCGLTKVRAPALPPWMRPAK